jgi:hypothetical protein
MKFRKRHYILLAIALLALVYLFVNRGGSYSRALQAPEKLDDVSATPSPSAPTPPERPLEVAPQK